MKNTVNCHGSLLDFSTPAVMGILNITPDSFYDGGKYSNIHEAIQYTATMLQEGASIIDIGAQSTRPLTTLISEEEEWQRLQPILIALRKEFPDSVFSIDTFYPEVALKAVDSGADMINDISGGTMITQRNQHPIPESNMFETIARLKVPYVLMHIGEAMFETLKQPHYENVVKEVMDYFVERIERLISLGVTDIILDPGFGFGKNTDHNYSLLKNLDLFKIFERPLLAGVSRKSMINKIIGTKPENALNGTTVLNTIALLKGAGILRVHDVKEAVQAIHLVKEMIR